MISCPHCGSCLSRCYSFSEHMLRCGCGRTRMTHSVYPKRRHSFRVTFATGSVLFSSQIFRVSGVPELRHGTYLEGRGQGSRSPVPPERVGDVLHDLLMEAAVDAVVSA